MRVNSFWVQKRCEAQFTFESKGRFHMKILKLTPTQRPG